MRKFLKALSGIVAAACLTATLAACDDDKEPKKPMITLDFQNGAPTKTVDPPFGNYIYGAKDFEKPTREGWFFTGWYLDAACTKSAYETQVKESMTIYAGWTDSTVVPMNQTATSIPYEELFDISIRAVPGGWQNTAKLYITVTPKGDFTGENSTDRFEIQVTHQWLSNEQFLGEYTDEVTAYACAREIYLEKSNNYTLTDYEIMTGGTTIPDYVFTENKRTAAKIDYIYGNPTLQYNHN